MFKNVLSATFMSSKIHHALESSFGSTIRYCSAKFLRCVRNASDTLSRCFNIFLCMKLHVNNKILAIGYHFIQLKQKQLLE